MSRENGLQTEAAKVERLRREIAVMGSRGEVASPQLLAEFARAQKNYLDKKIEFEKQRRASAEGKSQPSRTKTTEDGISATAPPGETTCVSNPTPQSQVQGAPKGGAGGGRNFPRLMIIVAVLLSLGLAAALAAWFFR
jgi:hypothetical protein